MNDIQTNLIKAHVHCKVDRLIYIYSLIETPYLPTFYCTFESLVLLTPVLYRYCEIALHESCTQLWYVECGYAQNDTFI